MDRPDILIDHEQRISTLEGIASETRNRLNSLETRMDNRFNSLTNLIVGVYGLIILVGVGTITAILTR